MCVEISSLWNTQTNHHAVLKVTSIAFLSHSDAHFEQPTVCTVFLWLNAIAFKYSVYPLLDGHSEHTVSSLKVLHSDWQLQQLTDDTYWIKHVQSSVVHRKSVGPLKSLRALIKLPNQGLQQDWLKELQALVSSTSPPQCKSTRTNKHGKSMCGHQCPDLTAWQVWISHVCFLLRSFTSVLS